MITRHGFRWMVAAILTLALLLGLPGSAAATELRSGQTITIGQGEVIDDDLFLFGTTVVMNGTVNGNLFAMGSQVQVNGTVNGSLFVGAQSVVVNGSVGGSLYVGATGLTLGPRAAVARNAMTGVYSLTTEAGSRIQRDLHIGAYQAVLGGEVGRDVNLGGAALELNGKVGRDVKAEVSEPGATGMPPSMFWGPEMPPAIAPGLRVSKEASIGGKLEYVSPVEQTNAIQSKPAGGISYIYKEAGKQEREPQGGPVISLISWTLDRVREFATLFVLGLLALWRLPDLINGLIARAQAQPLPTTGWGLLVLIGGFFLAFVAAMLILMVTVLFGVITLGGLASTVLGVGFSALGFVFAIFMLLVSYGAKLVVAYLTGRLILAQFKYAEHRIWTLAVGVLVLVLATSIPILGWLIGLIATLVGLGAMWLIWREQRPTRMLIPGIAPAA